MVYQKSRLFDIYPHAIANDVFKYKMTTCMYMIGAWKLLNLQKYVKNVQYPIVLLKPYYLYSKG
jgi:hypothetical protein